MSEQNAVGVQLDAGQVAALTALRTLLALAPLKLYKDSLAPTPATPVADFQAAEADFTGYADQALSWQAVSVDVNGVAVIVSTQALFRMTDAVAPNTIGGAWVELAGGTGVAYWPFDVPIGMAIALQFIAMTVEYGASGPGQANVVF